MSTLQEFVSEIKTFGTTSSNRYELVISPPKDFSNTFNNVSANSAFFNSSYTKSVSLRVLSVDLPERTFNLARRASRGIPVFLPMGSETTALQVKLLSSSDFGEYNLLNTWNSLIMDNQNGTLNFLNEYSGFADLYFPNQKDSQLHIQFLDLFPKNLPTIPVASNNKNELLTFSVTFQYKRFRNVTIGET